MSIEYEAAEDSEAVEIMVEEITSFGFSDVSITPRSTIAANNIKDKMPELCGKYALGWNPSGQIMIMCTKKGLIMRKRPWIPKMPLTSGRWLAFSAERPGSNKSQSFAREGL